MNYLFTPVAESLTSTLGAVGRGLTSELSDMSSYHELGLRRPTETNVLEELKNNIEQLEDLQLRLKFMMGEISQITRKRT